MVELPPDEYWTLQQEADHLKVSLRSIQYLIKKYGVPIIRAGNIVRFDDKAHEFLIEAMRVPPSPLRDHAPPQPGLHYHTPGQAQRAFTRALALAAGKPKPKGAARKRRP
jgi:hypothetical protein